LSANGILESKTGTNLKGLFVSGFDISRNEIFHYPKLSINPIAFLDEPYMMFRQTGSAPAWWCKNRQASLGSPPCKCPATFASGLKAITAIQKISVKRIERRFHGNKANSCSPESDWPPSLEYWFSGAEQYKLKMLARCVHSIYQRGYYVSYEV